MNAAQHGVDDPAVDLVSIVFRADIAIANEIVEALLSRYGGVQVHAESRDPISQGDPDRRVMVIRHLGVPPFGRSRAPPRDIGRRCLSGALTLARPCRGRTSD